MAYLTMPIAAAARSNARTVFARSNTAIVGSNPTGGMDVCVCSVHDYSVSTQSQVRQPADLGKG
jgi:hypothetical protein